MKKFSDDPIQKMNLPLELDAYQAFAATTDRSGLSGRERLNFMLLGLFGEIGSLLSDLKKKQRDKAAYTAYAQSAHEETGDVLWYLANVAHALGVRLSALAAPSIRRLTVAEPEDGVLSFAQFQQQSDLFQEPASNDYVRRSLLRLAVCAGRLVHHADPDAITDSTTLQDDLAQIFEILITASKDAHINLERAARGNIDKVKDRWPSERSYSQLFDAEYDRDEQLPRRLEVTFREKEVGGVKYVYQAVRGINLGDRLTDNSADEDDYRFHDVFHLAYAAVLGWSPVLRSLLRLKRKSQPSIDEQQDGARAIITEEGISNWIFAHGLRHRAFEGATSVDFDLLRTIRQMVKGYEVEVCASWMWEDAILQGFAVFRQLKANRAGVVIADLDARRLTYQVTDA